MECEEITRASTALSIMQSPADNRLEKLFHCIYSMFYDGFLNWIINKYDKNLLRDKLLENAKDAFQNGLIALYLKSKKNELNIRGSLKTTVYSFGLLQLLAFFKTDKSVYGKSEYIECFDLYFDDEFSESENQRSLNDREIVLIEAIKKLPKKQRQIILMKFFHDLSSKEIAKKLEVTPGYVDNVSTKVYKEIRESLMVKTVIKSK